MTPTKIEVPYNGQIFFIDIAEGNMVNLNNLYRISGEPDGKREPRRWKDESGKEFIDFLAKKLNVRIEDVYKTRRGKHGGGSWAHWQIALAYAKYLSNDLHYIVNQIFKERLEETINPEIGLTRSRERAIKNWKNQGHDDRWIAKREQHTDTRKIYVETLIEHDVKPNHEIGVCTNKIYKGLFGKDKSEIEQSIREKKPNLPKTINIRDHAKLSSIAAIGLAEALASEDIDEFNIRGVTDCAQVSYDKGASVHRALVDARSKSPRKEPPKQIASESYKKGITGLKNALKGGK